MHSSLGKNQIHNKGVAVPIRVRMIIVKVYAMSSDSKPDLSRESVEIQRGEASNTNFGGNDGVSDVPNLRRKSNISEGVQESRRKPITKSNEEFSLKVLQAVVNFVIARGELTSIGEKRHDIDIGGKDVEEKASTQILPSLYCVCSFPDGIVKLSVRWARSKLKAEILTVCYDRRGKPFRHNIAKTGREVLDKLIRGGKRDDNAFAVIEVQTKHRSKGLEDSGDLREGDTNIADNNSYVISRGT